MVMVMPEREQHPRVVAQEHEDKFSAPCMVVRLTPSSA
jgi:hypothetical protein